MLRFKNTLQNPTIMKRRHLIAFIATFGLIAAPPCSHASDFPKGSPSFLSSYDAALKAAKESGKPVVMVFSASWCPPCQANEKDVYPSAEVKPSHDKFVWAYLDADDKANHPAMQKFGVSGIPHIQFLTKDGTTIGHAVGGSSPQEFAAALSQVLARASGGAGGSGSKGSSFKN